MAARPSARVNAAARTGTATAGAGRVPCPRCGAAVPAKGARGACPGCGLALRFVDAPERPCTACGKPVAVAPGLDALRCGACGAWQAADPSRPLMAVADCPRCGREVEVPLAGTKAPCPRCGTEMDLGDPVQDTL